MTARQLLTFRLDHEFRQRLRTRLAGDGRSLSEVVIHGLQLYLQQGTPAATDKSTGKTAEKTVGQTAGKGTGQIASEGTGQAAGQSTDKTVAQAVGRTPGQSVGRTADKSTDKTADKAVGQTVGQSISRTADKAVGRSAGKTGAVSAVASVADLALPDEVATALRDLRSGGQSELLSATLAALHDAGWPLRPLAAALGISRQAVLARVRQPVPAEVRSRVPEVPPPAPFPRRRSARPDGRRPHLTVRIDQALRAAAHREAQREGSSLTQVVERILRQYLRQGPQPASLQHGGLPPASLHEGLPHDGLPHGGSRHGDLPSDAHDEIR